ncbi:MAG: hypothetical protein ACOH2I_09725 [Pseudomonas sp.]
MKKAEVTLPKPVLQAVQEGRYTQAVEMLSVHLVVSQEEAQQQLDRYLELNPPIPLRGAGVIAESKLNAWIWFGLILLMAAVYLLIA